MILVGDPKHYKGMGCWVNGKRCYGMGIKGMGIKGVGINGMGIKGMGIKGMGISGVGISGMGIKGIGFGSFFRSLGSKLLTTAKAALPSVLNATKAVAKDVLAEHGSKLASAVAGVIPGDDKFAQTVRSGIKLVGDAGQKAAQANQKPLPAGQKSLAENLSSTSAQLLKTMEAKRSGKGTNSFNNQFSK